MTCSTRIGQVVFFDEGDWVAFRKITQDERSDGPTVGVRTDALRGYVLRTIGEGYSDVPSRLRELLLPEDEVSVGTTQPGWPLQDVIRETGPGLVSVTGPQWDGALSEDEEATVTVPASALRYYVLGTLSQVVSSRMESCGLDVGAEILVLLLGGRLLEPRVDEPVTPPSTGARTYVPWRKPKAEERASYEVVWDALDDLRDATSMLVSEIAGTMMHSRACRRLADTRDPLRKAWFALHNKAYVPLPDADA